MWSLKLGHDQPALLTLHTDRGVCSTQLPTAHADLQEHVCAEHAQGLSPAWGPPSAGVVPSALPGLDLACDNLLSDCAQTWVRPFWWKDEEVSAVGHWLGHTAFPQYWPAVITGVVLSG